MRRGDALPIALRGHALDRMVADRTAAHPEATVLHLGRGLDSRGLRLDLPTTVERYDIDLPEVIDLRRRTRPESEPHPIIASPATGRCSSSPRA